MPRCVPSPLLHPLNDMTIFVISDYSLNTQPDTTVSVSKHSSDPGKRVLPGVSDVYLHIAGFFSTHSEGWGVGTLPEGK